MVIVPQEQHFIAALHPGMLSLAVQVVLSALFARVNIIINVLQDTHSPVLMVMLLVSPIIPVPNMAAHILNTVPV